MDTLTNIAILGVFMYACAGDYEPMKRIGFLLTIIGMIGSSIIYQRLKERIEELERQINKKNDIIAKNRQYKMNGGRGL